MEEWRSGGVEEWRRAGRGVATWQFLPLLDSSNGLDNQVEIHF